MNLAMGLLVLKLFVSSSLGAVAMDRRQVCFAFRPTSVFIGNNYSPDRCQLSQVELQPTDVICFLQQERRGMLHVRTMGAFAIATNCKLSIKLLLRDNVIITVIRKMHII
ncbi:hypothetical protein T12_2927 [Trichinella patagoniensis]|uniref:Secreted protein n=1 Tax=Trichinella patagoniensis TaxID=990121 RepID=A0A0V0ZNW3_9BILA|nr:hypothetical protein T12_2927 [Trichinella patagoniensis]